MSVLIKGITRLSELEIDADKDWREFGIINLKQVTASMSRGDLAVKETGILVRIQPGGDGLVLTSQGPGKLPVWAPKGGSFRYYFPVTIALASAQARVTVDRNASFNTSIVTGHAQSYLDCVPDSIKRLDTAIALLDAEVIAAADRSYSKSSMVGREGGIQMVVGGTVADDGGLQTDETTAARDATTNDMTLLPAAPVVNDAYYIGFARTFNRVWLNIGQAGVGNWALTEEYWNGAWVSLPDVVDKSNQFMASGLRSTTFTLPGDWAQTTILGMNLYWMRYRLSSFVNMSTQPKGTQAWCEVLV
jgi:hypothetical protein